MSQKDLTTLRWGSMISVGGGRSVITFGWKEMKERMGLCVRAWTMRYANCVSFAVDALVAVQNRMSSEATAKSLNRPIRGTNLFRMSRR